MNNARGVGQKKEKEKESRRRVNNIYPNLSKRILSVFGINLVFNFYVSFFKTSLFLLIFLLSQIFSEYKSTFNTLSVKN